MMRNQVMEQHFCQAIRNRVLVELRYQDDHHVRAFAPYVVYRTTANKICAFGMQVNLCTPNDRTDPHNFDLDKIRSVTLTTVDFDIDLGFDISKVRYRNRICPV